jgi:DNA-directed RNA polymerase subunit M/transcription elongation factor TFIIS
MKLDYILYIFIMICSHCNNILATLIESSSLKFQCTNCGVIYNARPMDLKIHTVEDNKSIGLGKKGSDIFHFPSNTKELRKCPRCPKKILAWEYVGDMRRLFGCECGHSFVE